MEKYSRLLIALGYALMVTSVILLFCTLTIAAALFLGFFGYAVLLSIAMIFLFTILFYQTAH